VAPKWRSQLRLSKCMWSQCAAVSKPHTVNRMSPIIEQRLPRQCPTISLHVTVWAPKATMGQWGTQQPLTRSLARWEGGGRRATATTTTTTTHSLAQLSMWEFGRAMGRQQQMHHCASQCMTCCGQLMVGLCECQLMCANLLQQHRLCTRIRADFST
jgi:hypothetical protein